MCAKVLMKRGSSKNARSRVSSKAQALRLKKALEDLENYSIDELIRARKVYKIQTHTERKESIYAYRLGLNERIIFTSRGNENIIHDIVVLDRRKIRSLISS